MRQIPVAPKNPQLTVRNFMRQFKPKPGTKSALRILNTPFPNITVFDALVQSIVHQNPLGCTSYMTSKRNHPRSRSCGRCILRSSHT